MKKAILNWCGTYYPRLPYMDPDNELIPTGRWKIIVEDGRPNLLLEVYANYEDHKMVEMEEPTKILGIFPTTVTIERMACTAKKTNPTFISEVNLRLTIIEEYPVQTC